MKSIAILSFVGPALVVGVPTGQANTTTLADRQASCFPDRRNVGDGSPRQRYKLKQISQVLGCSSDNSCSVGASQSQSYTITAELGGAEEWLSGGFSVSYTWETGNDYTCDGGPNDQICVWQKVAHTAYQTALYNPCGSPDQTPYDNAEISSPNNNNRGGGFYCVTNTCRNQGDEYWVDGDAGTG